MRHRASIDFGSLIHHMQHSNQIEECLKIVLHNISLLRRKYLILDFQKRSMHR